jgi:AmmeMemoRadiSam system protein A
LYEGTKNKFIKEYYSEYLLNLCRNVILSKFNKDTLYTGHAPVFTQLGACFVTLKKNNNLRGCIGSIIAHQPLINDIVEHAKDAAFRDPRFNPVEQNEVDSLTIDISILSEPQPMTFRDEQDLLEQIVPFSDGIIIKDKNRQAVYLPSVWEDLPDKAMFLNSLKIKAGLPPEHFSDTFEAYRFSTVYIEEK